MSPEAKIFCALWLITLFGYVGQSCLTAKALKTSKELVEYFRKEYL